MLAALPRWAAANDVVKLVKSEPLRPAAMTSYDFALLREVLERTRPDYGGYELQKFSENVSNARAIQLAIKGGWSTS
jgi:hypothetical protein